MLRKNAGKMMLCAALVILASGPVASADNGKDKSKNVRPHAQRVDLTQAYSAIFGEGGGGTTEAECTADCGDGTGWVCTGTTVSCSDGADGGCTAEAGGKKITAEC